MGVAIEPMSRTRGHSHAAEWFQEVVRIEIEWLASREAALWAEGAAIKKENPKHNIIRPGRFGIAARSHQMKEDCDKVLAEADSLGIKLQRNACLSRLKKELQDAKSGMVSVFYQRS